MKPEEIKYNAIEKALMLLQVFAPHNQEMGTLEISEKLGFNKATVSRTLIILAKHGFLYKNPISKKFKLGHAALNLGMAVSGSLKNDMVQIAKPFIDELRDQVQESVILEVMSGKFSVGTYVAEGPRRSRLAGSIGDMLPIHAASGGKAILAFCPSKMVDTILDDHLIKLTKNTITDPQLLKTHLNEIKKQGIAYDFEELDLDLKAVAAPVFDRYEHPVAAVVIASASQRFLKTPDSKIVGLLKRTALKISEQLFYPGAK